MFKGHPKGLLAAALSNMGERFGFYTMMAILVLFLQSKFGLDGTSAGIIYSVFYALIYILALVGGVIADKTRNYKGTILAGLIVMALGYLMIAIPSPTPVPTGKELLFLIIACAGLFVIAFGNGLFKGNLQALVGQMYDDPKYSDQRDAGFQIFYMFINLGAMFAPFTAKYVRGLWLKKQGFLYNPNLPSICHSYLDGTITPEGTERLVELSQQVDTAGVYAGNLDAFVHKYLDSFVTGFHYAFGVAIITMAISVVIFLVNQKRLPDVQKYGEAAANGQPAVEMDPKEVRQRIFALFAVFAVVIFFWFSFHQNGLTLTFFARDYTNLNLFGYQMAVEDFQAFNPIYVVSLTFVIIALFSWLRSKGMEPSTPKKIAIGMFIAALGFFVMTIGSIGLPLYSDVQAMGSLPDAQKVTPFLLIGTYLILTVAELFISPLGISFVSKVAPPQYQGLMQGGWLGATALGNQLLFIGAIFYESIPIWLTWGIFVVACLISMGVMLAMLKWLERVAA